MNFESCNILFILRSMLHLSETEPGNYLVPSASHSKLIHNILSILTCSHCSSTKTSQLPAVSVTLRNGLWSYLVLDVHLPQINCLEFNSPSLHPQTHTSCIWRSTWLVCFNGTERISLSSLPFLLKFWLPLQKCYNLETLSAWPHCR